jgi:hypothetical protein
MIDPIYSLIIDYNSALAGLEDALHVDRSIDLAGRQTPEVEAAGEVLHAAEVALLTTPASSLEGVVALLRFVRGELSDPRKGETMCSDERDWARLLHSLEVAVARAAGLPAPEPIAEEEDSPVAV